MSIGGNFNNCPLNSDKSFRFFHLHAKLIYARVYVEQSSNRTGNLNLNNSHEDESDETTKVPAIYTKNVVAGLPHASFVERQKFGH